MKLRRSRSAAGMVEYSLIASLVALGLIVILALFGTGVGSLLAQVVGGLEGHTGTPPSTLVVNITNLYATTPGDLGVQPSVLVTGPNGYTQALTASTTLPNLPAGNYFITANSVTAVPPSQTVADTFYPTVTPSAIFIPSFDNTSVVDYSNAVPATTFVVQGADLALLTAVTADSSSCPAEDETQPNDQDAIATDSNGVQTDIETGEVIAPCATTTYAISFSGPLSFSPIVPGDALVFDPSTLTPSSLMVTVNTVTGNSLTATQASFNDVVSRANFTSTVTTDSPSFTTPSLTPQGLAPHANAISVGCGQNAFVSYTRTGNGTHQVFLPTLKIAWPGQDQSGDYIGLTVGIYSDEHITLDSAGELSIFCQVSIKGVTVLAPLIPLGFIGPVPVWLDPSLKFNASLNFNIQPNGHHPWFTYDGTLIATLGFLCDNTGCHTSHQLSFTGAGPNFLGDGSIDAKFGPRLDFKFEGLAGPYVAAYGYGTFRLTPRPLTATCDNGELGIAWSVGVAVGLPGPFGSLWSLQGAELKQPLGCLFPVGAATPTPTPTPTPSPSPSPSPSPTPSPTCTPSGAFTNPDFETGTLCGWTITAGSTSVVTNPHSGTYAAQLNGGSLAAPLTSPYQSVLQQSFVVPANGGTLSIWYKPICPAISHNPPPSSNQDFTAIYVIDPSNAFLTLVSNTCTNDGIWLQATMTIPTSRAGQTLKVTVYNSDGTGGSPYWNTWPFTTTLVDDLVFTPCTVSCP